MIDNIMGRVLFSEARAQITVGDRNQIHCGAHFNVNRAHTHITRTFSAVLLTVDLAAYVYNAADAYTRYTVIACGSFLIFVDF